MRSESDQYGPRQSILLLRTTPFEKGLTIVFKEGQLCLVFIVPSVAIMYHSCPPPPLSPCHWIPYRTLWLYVQLLSGDWGGSSPASHCDLPKDRGDGLIVRSSSYFTGPKDGVAQPHRPHQHAWVWKVLRHRPR